MKLDKTQPLYILYGCNIVKERSTMRLVAATTDEEMLKVIIGSQILLGVMDYRGFSNMKGFQQFRAACRNGDERYDDLSYGFVEQTENLLLPDCAKEPHELTHAPDALRGYAATVYEPVKAVPQSAYDCEVGEFLRF